MNKKIKIFMGKKVLLSVIISLLFIGITFGNDGVRTCETIYSEINGARYFSSMLCTEDIKLTGVVADEVSLKDVSTREMNDFIVANYGAITEHIDEGNTCEDLDSVDDIQDFESVIYSKNDISYTSTTSNVESLTTTIEDLEKEYNSPDLYGKVFNEVKGIYSSSSIDFLRLETMNRYFNKQLEIKNDILDKQKEKLTLLYKLKESQKFIEKFYDQINPVCEGYYNKVNKSLSEEEKNIEIKTTEEKEEEEKGLIKEYKLEFNESLGNTLDAMSRQKLQKLSVKLLDYAETSPIFKRFSEAQRKTINLKITALKEVIDDRIDLK